MRVLQRVVMPADHDPDLAALYVADQPGRVRDAGATRAAGRYGAVVPAGGRASFCTYFNAFAAGYWRRWSTVEEVRLRVRLRGEGTLIVYRSDAAGHPMRIKAARVTAGAAEHAFTLPLDPFIDGGWYWFEIVADEDVELVEADWSAETDARQGTATVGITTFNRPRFCVELLQALGRSTGVLDEVIVVDQGGDRIGDHPDFAAAAEALGDRLRVIDQPNLGGSGGFSRAMAEALRADRSDYVLLLDDDIAFDEPESIVRAITFADLARTPTIVGGHMLDLLERSVLAVYGDTVARYRWWTEAAPNTHLGHDFARHPLRDAAWLHRRAESDFNGWWMCLIPLPVVRKLGLSLPVFIKWDDVEYGLRAQAAGVPTVSLPGAAVWHMPWHAKDTATDWQMYFQERNRLITALMHSPYDRGGNMLKESLFVVIKHALAMQYSTAELMLKGLRDTLEGPGVLHQTMAAKLAEVRSLRAEFTDARAKADIEAFPPARRKPPKRGRATPPAPEGTRALVRAAMRSALRQLRPVGDLARTNPQTVVPFVDQRWWLLARLDSALVSSAEGTTVSWYRRDRERFVSIIRRAIALHAELMRRWPALAEEYRSALPGLVAPETWQETFDRAQDGP
jgi:galactofuranosylgalactofuranosylrhamnosyl-N-acetylglucosaminyl-diphospho-decaprenol beta-1,5/1,6-galactofuranosyltransferase